MSSVDLVVQTIEERLPQDQRNSVGQGVRRLFSRVKDLSGTRLMLIKQFTELQVTLSEKREEIATLQKRLRMSIESSSRSTQPLDLDLSEDPGSGAKQDPSSYGDRGAMEVLELREKVKRTGA